MNPALGRIHGWVALALSLAAASCAAPESAADSPAVGPDSAPSVVPRTSSQLSAPWDTSSAASELVRIDSVSLDEPPGAAASRLVFADSGILEIAIRDARLLGVLDGESGRRWMLLSGYPCAECDANILVYAVRASTGTYPGVPRRFPHPGPISEAGVETRPFFRSRMFIGHCLGALPSGAVWLEEGADSTGTWHRRARLLAARAAIDDSMASWTSELEAEVLSAVRAGQCREIAPIEQYAM